MLPKAEKARAREAKKIRIRNPGRSLPRAPTMGSKSDSSRCVTDMFEGVRE